MLVHTEPFRRKYLASICGSASICVYISIVIIVILPFVLAFAGSGMLEFLLLLLLSHFLDVCEIDFFVSVSFVRRRRTNETETNAKRGGGGSFSLLLFSFRTRKRCMNSNCRGFRLM